MARPSAQQGRAPGRQRAPSRRSFCAGLVSLAGLASLAALGGLAACSHGEPPAPAHRGPPRRVVSLAPSMSEILVALHLDDRLVGVSDYCEGVTAKPPPARVGGLNNLNVEAILSLHPDLVLTVQRGDDRSLLPLARAGVEVMARDPESLEAVFATVEAVGERFERGDAARELVAGLRARLARVAAALAKAPSRPRVYVEVDYPPPWTIGRRSFVRDALVAAGGENLFDDLAAPYPTVDPEAIVVRDPDWILLLHPLDAPLAQRAGFAGLRAVRAGHVITDVDRDALLHSSPRLVDGIEQLARRLGADLPAPEPGR
jgi:iron complex transport system substrate-binding protein